MNTEFLAGKMKCSHMEFWDTFMADLNAAHNTVTLEMLTCKRQSKKPSQLTFLYKCVLTSKIKKANITTKNSQFTYPYCLRFVIA